jgi:tetratricopeptide (TPR) repeat protein
VRPDAPPEYDVLVGQQFEVAGRTAEALAAYERAVAKDEASALLHRKLAEMLARSNRLPEALEHAQRAVALEPEDLPTRLFLAQLHRIERNPDAAIAVLLDEQGEPFDANAAHLLYQIYSESGRREEALAVAVAMVREEPDSLRARMALAGAQARLGRDAEAEATLRDALELDPGNLRVYGALARSLRERGDRDDEIALYRELLAIYPHHRTTLIALGEAQMAMDDLDGAIATFEEVERRHPDDVRSAVRLAYLYYEARRFAESAERFERAHAANPEEHEITFFLGVVRRRAGDGAGAIAAFEQIPPEDEQFADARTQIAAIYEQNGDYPRALAEVELATSHAPSRALDLYAATLRSKAGDFEGAVAQLERLLTEAPTDDELLYNLGVVYGEAKRVDESIRYMQRAIEQNPENASALNYVGYTWAERGVNLDEAERMIVRAIELRPDDGYIADSLGWVHYQRARSLLDSGQRKQARVFIDKALAELGRADELTGGDPVISEHLGDTYLLLDQKRRALHFFEEAIRLEPREGEQPDLHEKVEALRRELE